MPRQSIYLPDDLRAEVRAESVRLQRTYGWLVRRAWQIARERIAVLPDAKEGR